MTPKKNIDSRTVAGFGDEWTRFDQSDLSESEHRELFDNYFSLFPWEALTEDAQGFDLGCGSGRWQNWLLLEWATCIALIRVRLWM